MEFTTEQQAYIDKLIDDKTATLYTKDELDKRVMSEVDRRVESGIQKGLETNKAKWEADYKVKAQLSAEEVAKMEVKEQLDSIAQREATINKRSNEIDARDLLSTANIPQEDYSKFLGLLVSDDSEMTKTNVTNFIDTFNTTKQNIEANIKKQLSNVQPPKAEPDELGQLKNTSINFMEIANEGNIRK